MAESSAPNDDPASSVVKHAGKFRSSLTVSEVVNVNYSYAGSLASCAHSIVGSVPGM